MSDLADIEDTYAEQIRWASPDAARADFRAAVREHVAQEVDKLADQWAADPDAWGDNDKDYRNELRDRAEAIRKTEP